MIEKKKTRSELKREAILRAARQAFHEYGVQNTSMDKLAALANVSKRTVYNHFASKEALVMELLSVLWKSTITADALEELAQQPLEEQLTTLLYQEILVFSKPEYLDMAKVAIGHFLFQPDALQEQMKNMSKEDTALHAWLVAQQEKSTLTMDNIEQARSQLHNLIKGSAFWPQLIGACQPISEEEGLKLARNTATFFLSHYRK
ncbi:TetR/AcrR family transcriptional regulator [Enterovibrio norvegicus]|uniref:TetR/AcrR family transcriptional regulator n=1 Tax=Enterovibrio norvegicus TaxID=188144 RepID=UPI000C836762|nr:TetR/AcrR family transcriptional regulator [Enterovibrio norvegicus]PMN70226.1 TetR family transcriptional regulator [Enterovibrio norvegicus]